MNMSKIKVSLLALAMIIFTTTFSQSINELKINAPIKKVKLYFSSAEMQHESETKIQKGRNKIIFRGISSYAFAESIQFSAEGKHRLVSVSTEMDFMAGEQNNPRIKTLKDSVDKLSFTLSDLNNQLDAFNVEKGLLMVNQNLKGDNQNLTVAQLKEAADFYRVRTLEINTNVSRLSNKIDLQNVKISEYRRQLLELNFNENNRSNQVIVLLDAEEASSSKLKLNYLVSECGWAALYDLRADDLTQPINLKYKAQIFNNTGDAWENVELVLSTADPMMNASAPKLEPWFLNFNTYQSKANKMEYSKQNESRSRAMLSSDLQMANQRSYDEYNSMDSGRLNDKNSFWSGKTEEDGITVFQKTVAMRTIEVSELSSEFLIPYVFSCPSDAKPYTVEVKEFALKATFSHIAIPKLSNGAYLMANITDWQDLSLVPGPTHVYFAGKYVGRGDLDTKTIDDTLSLSLGRDEKIVIMRKLKEEMTIKKTVGSNKKEQYTFDIMLRNNRATPITINVFDQIPVSRHSDITVGVENISNAKRNEETGELEWMITLGPNESKSVELSYEIKYPKNATITTKKYRTISAPSF
jgi:uncharacterized protein (TIGR02231 family)